VIRSQRASSFQHSVAFYDNDHVLVEQIAAFLDLDSPGTAVVVATPTHRAALERRPTKQVARYIGLDADTLLPEVMLDNFPDERRFRAFVEHLFSTSEGPIRIYGEMVALLWERGNVPAALKLEKLWNSVAEDHRLSLFCAYPTSLFQGSASLEAYLRMCGTHSELVPFKG
jgi:hypothetical protein